MQAGTGLSKFKGIHLNTQKIYQNFLYIYCIYAFALEKEENKPNEYRIKNST